MKIKKYFYFLAAMSLVTLTACDDDDDKSPSPQAAERFGYFPSIPGEQVILKLTENSFNVTLNRADQGDALNEPFTIAIEEFGDIYNVFNTPENITFEPGESSKEFTITASNLVPFKVYPYGIRVKDAYANPYVEGEFSVTEFYTTVIQDDWKKFQMGDYTSSWWGETYPAEMQYSELLDCYRILDFCDSGSILSFYWDRNETDTIAPAAAAYSSEYIVPDHGLVTAKAVTKKWYYDTKTKEFYFEFEWVAASGASFGEDHDIFVITE